VKRFLPDPTAQARRASTKVRLHLDPRALPATALRTLIRRDVGQRERRRLHARKFANRTPRAELLAVDECEALRFPAAVARATDAMHEVLGHQRHIVIHHRRDSRHMQTSRGNIRRDKTIDRPRREGRERFIARTLRTIAMQDIDRHLVMSQRLRDPTCAAARSDIHHHALHALLADERNEQRRLVIVGDIAAHMTAMRGRVAKTHIHSHRFPHQLQNTRFSRRRQCCADAHHLAIGRHPSHHTLHLRHETHVHHAVCLVHDDATNAGERERPKIEQLKQAPGRTHENVHTTRDEFSLRSEGALAEHRTDAKHAALCRLCKIARHLLREFARRRQNDRAKSIVWIHEVNAPTRLVPHWRLRQKLRHERHPKRQRFSAAGGRKRKHIAALHEWRMDRSLHRRWRSEAKAIECSAQMRGDIRWSDGHAIARVVCSQRLFLIEMGLALGIIAVVVALPLLWVLLTYNGLVRGRVRAQASFSQIDVQLKRRCDLIPNLVETVKGAMAHERQTLEAVTRARQAALAGLGALQMKPDDYVALRTVAQASQSIDRLLAGLRVTIENYPQLKTSTNVLALQEELSSTENRIAFARQAYNDSVMSYNTALAVFPSNLIAGLFRFTAMGLFEAAGDDRALPEVRLSAND